MTLKPHVINTTHTSSFMAVQSKQVRNVAGILPGIINIAVCEIQLYDRVEKKSV